MDRELISGLPQRVRQMGQRLIVLSLLVGMPACLPIWGDVSRQLPSPEEAARQAENLSPEELTDLEIDAEMRDRLRFDPRWQPIAEAVRQDIMILKWGDNQLENPVWERYGAEAYPLLDYYARSADPTRQVYGMVGLRQLGQPYTTLWLEKQLQRPSTELDFFLITAHPDRLLDPNGNAPYEANWQQEFGLDDPATRDRLLQIARDHLEPANSPTYYQQFNLAFIQAVTGENPWSEPSPDSDVGPALDPALGEWNQLEAIAQPTPEQIQQAMTVYENLSPNTQEYLLVTRLGRVNAGEISLLGQELLQRLASDLDSPERVWAIAELDRHGDPAGSAQLLEILNGDLTQLHSLSRWVSFSRGFWTEGVDRPTHAYYLLLGMAEKYPQSKFVQAAREYGELTGRYYFSGEPRSGEPYDFTVSSMAEQETAWRDWLRRYPDHPGADDATYFLARSLQDQGDIAGAMELWMQMMQAPMGDGDALYLAWPHVRTLLDVGFSTTELETLVEQHRDRAIAPLLTYALAVHQARDQDYDKALSTSENLDLTAMPLEVLGSYYGDQIWFWRPLEPDKIQASLQTLLNEQRQRWLQLQQWQAEDTPESWYQIASNWAGAGGWKNGYLGVWEEARTYLLPTGSWGDDYCQIYWVCNASLRTADALRTSYQQASQNAIALQLYEQILTDPRTPDSLQEKTLYMAASTLLWQWEDHPLGETFRIHPPAGVTAVQVSLPDSLEPYERWQAQLEQTEQSYIAYLEKTIAQLQQEFPDSPYIDDLLFSRFAMSGEMEFLQQIVEQYPEGDRAQEARFLLQHRRSQP